jgi:hypothetical protein
MSEKTISHYCPFKDKGRQGQICVEGQEKKRAQDDGLGERYIGAHSNNED